VRIPTQHVHVVITQTLCVPTYCFMELYLLAMGSRHD